MKGSLRRMLPALLVLLVLGQASAHLYPMQKDAEIRLYDGAGRIVGQGYETVQAYPSDGAPALWYGVRYADTESGRRIGTGELWTDGGTSVYSGPDISCTAVEYPGTLWDSPSPERDALVMARAYGKGERSFQAIYGADGKPVPLHVDTSDVYEADADDRYLLLAGTKGPALIDRGTGKYVEGFAPPRKYDGAWPWNYYGNGLFTKAGGEGLYDLASGRLLAPLENPRIQRVGKNALRVELDGNRMGLMREEGTWIVQPAYPNVTPPCADGLAAVQDPSGNWGVADAGGAWRLPVAFDRVDLRDAGPIIARRGRTVALYARDGTEAAIGDIADARGVDAYAIAYAASGARYLVDGAGKALPLPGADFVPLGADRIAARQAGGLWGVYDPSGNVLCAPSFSHLRRIEGRDAFVAWKRVGKGFEANLYALDDGRALLATGCDDIAPVGADGYQLVHGATYSLWVSGAIKATW